MRAHILRMARLAILVLGIVVASPATEAPVIFFTEGPMTVARGEFIILYFGHKMATDSDATVEAEVFDAVSGRLLHTESRQAWTLRSIPPMKLDTDLFMDSHEKGSAHQTIMIRLRSYDHHAASELQTSIMVLGSSQSIGEDRIWSWTKTQELTSGVRSSAPFLLTENHDATIRLFNASDAPSMVTADLVDTSSGQVVHSGAVNLQPSRGHAFPIPKRLMNSRFNAIPSMQRLPLVGVFQLRITIAHQPAQGDLLVSIEADSGAPRRPFVHKMTMQAINNRP